MKKWLKVLLTLMLVVACVFTYAACNNSGTNNGGGNEQNSDQNQKPGGNGQGTGNTDEDTDFLEDAWQINFRYSYTAQIVNDNDRTQNKQADVIIATIQVPYEDADKGWTPELMAKMEAITYHGYKFETWYPAWNEDTQSGWYKASSPEYPVGDPYDFANAKIDGDINLYAYKGDVAGDNVTWDITFKYETDAAIVADDKDEDQVAVTFTTVAWVDSIAKNVVEKVALSALLLEKDTGWTTEALAAKDAIRYDGYQLTWYADWDMATMQPKGDAYSFAATPEDDLVLYGVLSAVRDTEFEETAKSLVSGVLELNGSGDMYGFNDANTIDVPWFTYKSDITSVIMSDEITNIGKNAFAKFGSLKSIEFSENIVAIGENAFYECNNASFRTLRLPSKVVSIAKQAFANTKLREVILNDGLKSIGESAFSGAHTISSIVVPTSLEKVETGAFFSGSKSQTHSLSKIYYMGTDRTGFDKIQIGLDNESFQSFAAVYCYKEPVDGQQIEGLYWYLYEVDSVKYPAQHSYALKYYVGTDKNAKFTDFVPAVPKYVQVYEEQTDAEGKVVRVPVVDAEGNPVTEQEFDPNTGMPVFEGHITAQNMINYNIIMNAGKIYETDAEGNQKPLIDLGFGFIKITGINDIAEGVAINGDKSLTCVRANYSSGANDGILGGGITWTLSNGTLEIYPASAEDEEKYGEAANIMWDFYKNSDVEVLWDQSAMKVPSIKKVIIHDGVKNIGNYVFSSMGIKEIVIPASVKTIGADSFVGCTSLNSIYYAGESFDVFNYTCTDEKCDCATKPGKHNYVSEIRNSNVKVYAKTAVGVAADGAYWIEYENGKKIAWTLNDGALYIGGDDEMMDFVLPSEAPWFGALESINSVTVARNIVSLGTNMVSGYYNVKSISLPTVLRKIPESALEGTALVNNAAGYDHGILVIDGHLIKVDAARRNTEFFDLSILSNNINAPEKTVDVINIADGAFSRCTNIKVLFVPNTVQYINANAFADLDLEKIFIDQASGTWENAAKDFDYKRIRVFFKGQYFIGADGKYTSNSCNHVYEEDAWVVEKAATCVEEGIMTRTCIFADGDPNHAKETKKIPINPNAHSTPLVEGTTDPSCEVNQKVIYKCAHEGCAYFEAGEEIADSKLEHDFANIVDDDCKVEDFDEEDPEYYKSCTACGAHSTETFKPEAGEEE